MPRDLQLQVLFLNLFPQDPDHPIGGIVFLSNIRDDIQWLKLTNTIVDIGGKLMSGCPVLTLIFEYTVEDRSQ